MKLRIYLAGYSEEYEYRNYVIQEYGNIDKLDIVNPLNTNYDDIYENIGKNCCMHYLVTRDKKLILTCHVLIAYVRVGSTWGTTMEVIYAYSNHIPVFLIDPTKNYRTNPWLRFHVCEVFDGIDECFDFILDKKIVSNNFTDYSFSSNKN